LKVQGLRFKGSEVPFFAFQAMEGKQGSMFKV
jgi:hypothetical protein